MSFVKKPPFRSRGFSIAIIRSKNKFASVTQSMRCFLCLVFSGWNGKIGDEVNIDLTPNPLIRENI